METVLISTPTHGLLRINPEDRHPSNTPLFKAVEHEFNKWNDNTSPELESMYNDIEDGSNTPYYIKSGAIEQAIEEICHEAAREEDKLFSLLDWQRFDFAGIFE